MALRLVLGAMLLILAVTSTLKGLVVMYKTTKKWQLNHYMQQFVTDGVLYFVAYVPLSSFFQFHSFPLLHSPIHVTLDNLQKN